MRIELNCRECGDNRFSLDKVHNDDAIITCDSCGHVVGTLGDLKDKVAELVLKGPEEAAQSL